MTRLARFRWRAVPRHARAAGLVVVAASAFTVAVDLVRWIRPVLLFHAEPWWIVPCALLWLFIAASAALVSGLLWGVVVWLSRTPIAGPSAILPFSGRALAAVFAVAVSVGCAARLVALSDEPAILYVDDVSLIPPTLELSGSLADFRDSIRPAPYGARSIYGSVGVLYLQLYRLSLDLWGTTVMGVRFPSALGGMLSILTAALLGRAVLPTGGGMLTAVVLAGLRWNLILSRWGWVMIVLAPIIDLAALLAIRSRRSRPFLNAGGAGLIAGVGAHVYLAAWPAAAALAAVVAWPREGIGRGVNGGAAFRSAAARAALFCLAFALAVSPLFLFHEGRQGPYFARVGSHGVLQEIQYQHSVMPLFAAAADSLGGPWFVPDPTPRGDLPGRTRLGLLAVLLFIACVRALLRPREDLSALLIAHGVTALASSIAGGEALLPNGYRYAYLSTVTAVGIASGFLSLLAWVPASRRRVAAIALVGSAAVASALGIRETLVTWSPSRAYFDDIYGFDTAIGRTAARWARMGTTAIEPDVMHHKLTARLTFRYRLDPAARRHDVLFGSPRPGRSFRVVLPGTLPQPGERVVERVRDGWGREWAAVLGRASPARAE